MSSSDTSTLSVSTVNNFDLIRLFAASQVAVTHAAHHLDYHAKWLSVLSLFPGVPIFFFISGFLIYPSLGKSLNSPQPLRNFFVKRALRLYPALIVCFLFSLAVLWFSGYLATVDFSPGQFFAWALTALTFMQFYNPEFLRDFGVGVINGSLWTISVELQFYVLTPLVYFAFRRFGPWWFVAITAFILPNVAHEWFVGDKTLLEKLITVSFVPWFYMFLLGAFLACRPDIVRMILRLPLLLLLLLFVGVWWLSLELGMGWGNGINPVGYVLLVGIILKLAYTNPEFSDRMLRRNDISYGVYIYHMPIINLLLAQEFLGLKGFALALAATIVVALLSWLLVEQPALRLKKSQLRKV